MKKLLKLIVALLVITAALLTYRFIVLPIATTQGIASRTMNAENAIYNYEWFITQEADIRKCLKNEQIAESALTSFISSLPTDRTQWSTFDKKEEASLRNSLVALQQVTNQAIETYNAKSEMANRNIFKDNLPSNISRAFYASAELATQ
ncbi:hypothetical protein [Massilibacteroides sp.]|uniref:hypothetical protein n=1 Tax=Massilibacteroides sp. TaxID=2034766 RepID=UPI002639A43C|nr:hypothetical protein [Massilibacteroides sp.]MDD4516577.1 hypothetical protein [Massilibacteroides sp.]